MTTKKELENLKREKEKFEKAIEFTKEKQQQITLTLKNLISKLNSHQITENEYKNKLNYILNNKTPEQWIKYYEDYIKYYGYQIKLCDKLVKQKTKPTIYKGWEEKPKKRKLIPILSILIVIVLIAIIISVFINLTPIGIQSFSKVKQESSETISYSNEEVLETPTILPINLDDEQAIIKNESFKQYQAVIEQPVKWKKQFTTNSITGFNIKLPKDSKNIILKSNGQDITQLADIDEEWIGKEINIKLKKNKLTGNAVANNQEQNFEIIYETPAPKIEVIQEGIKTNIKIMGPDNVHYQDVFSFVDIPGVLKIGEEDKLKLYQTKQDGIENKKQIPITLYDADENGLYDKVEWTTSRLSAWEGYLIIEISKAEHLDENGEFISNIYEQVKALDSVWSEEIKENEYVRVTFKQLLDNTKDITIYPKIVSGNPRIEVYEINGTSKITEFTNLISNRYNKVYLTNLPENHNQDIFNLKVINGSIEIEHIIDPNLNIRSGMSTTNTGGAAAISFTANMPSSSYSVLISGNTDTDTMYSMTYLNKADTGFSVKAEDDRGANEVGNFEWIAIGSGNYFFESNTIKCGAGPSSGSTINFQSSFPDTDYAVIANSIDDSDSPLINFVGGSKTTGSFQIDIEDDKGRDEAVTTTDYCAFSIGEYNLNNVKIKTGTSTTATSGDTTIGFSSSFSNTNYIVIAMAQAVNHNLCAPEIVTKNAADFTIHFENDAGANCANRNFDWIAVEIGEFVIDKTPPNIIFTPPTPKDGTKTTNNSLFINVTADDSLTGNNNISTFINFDNSLLGWWRMDDTNGSTNSVVDYTGMNNGTLQGNAIQNSFGKIGRSFSFDGDGDFIKIGNNPNFGASPFTITTWVNTYNFASGTNPDWADCILSKGLTGLKQAGDFAIYIDGKNIGSDFEIDLVNASGTRINGIDTGEAITSNRWYFISAEYNGTSISLYVNGILKNSKNVGIIGTSSSDLLIGRTIDNPTYSNWYYDFNGSIDDIMIFNRSLSASEIQALYANTTLKYVSNNFTNLVEGTHTFKAYSQDTIGNINSTETKSITIGDANAPNVKLNSPEDKTVITKTLIKFNCSATNNKNLLNATLYFKTQKITKTLYFKEDGSFVNKTEDTQLDANSPTTNYGFYPEINIDGSNPHAHGVIKFPNIFGNQENQIPLGAKIINADLTLEISNKGDDMLVYRLKENWTESQTTWNNRFIGNIWLTPGADIPNSADNSYYETFPAPIGIQTYGITKFIQNWSDGLPNYGIVLTNTGNNGIDFYTSEASSNQRPVLSVTYEYTAIPWHANQTKEISGTENESIFFLNLATNQEYEWNCLVYDLIGNSNWSKSDYTFSIPRKDENPNLVLDFPYNKTTLTSEKIILNFTAQDDLNLKNATLYFCEYPNCLNWHANQTISISGKLNKTNFDLNLKEATYIWNILVYDNASQLVWAESNFTFTINDTPPTIFLITPEDKATSTNTNITFNCLTTDDEELVNITLYGNWTGVWHANQTKTISGTSNSTTFELNLTDKQTYEWNCLVYDSENQHSSSPLNYTLTIDSDAEKILPSATLNSPTNNIITPNISINFNCSAEDNKQLSKITLYYKTKSIIKTIYFGEDGSFVNKTEDTQLDADAPDTNHYSSPTINIDGSNPHAHAVMRFPNIFGNQENRIPLGAKIISADLSLEIFNGGDNMQVYRLKEDWIETQTTWNNRFIGNIWLTPGADIPNSADNSYYETFPASKGIQTYSITKFMQNWSDGLPNYGIVLTNTGNNGIDFYTSEASSNQRPLLTVTYEYTAIPWHANQTKYVSGTSNSTIFQVNLTNLQEYEWNCLTTDVASNKNFSNQNYTFKIINQPPQITHIESIPNQAPIENSIKTINFNIEVSDPNGASDIKSPLAVEFSKSGETTRIGTCPWQSDIDTNTASYLCSVDMQHYDGAGTWIIKIQATDSANNLIEDTSRTFVYQDLKSILISPLTLNWPDLVQGATNQLPGTSTTITNIGNHKGQVSIQAKDLYGETNPAEIIPANAFTSGTITGANQECNAPTTATQLQDNTPKTIINSMLNKGISAQEEIFYCISQIPQISSQTYSTPESWTITILFVAITIKNKKKKSKKKQKNKQTKIIKDNLIISLTLLSKEIKQEYSKEKQEIITLLSKEIKKKYKLNNKELIQLTGIKQETIPLSIFKCKLGALESICRYMRENLNIKYKEIADLLQRNERTIWVAHNKAKQKQPEAIKIKQEKILIPISIFNKKLTILESIIIYLKKQNLKYVEIGQLLNRDQRNIWTIYSRAIKK